MGGDGDDEPREYGKRETAEGDEAAVVQDEDEGEAGDAGEEVGDWSANSIGEGNEFEEERRARDDDEDPADPMDEVGTGIEFFVRVSTGTECIMECGRDSGDGHWIKFSFGAIGTPEVGFSRGIFGFSRVFSGFLAGFSRVFAEWFQAVTEFESIFYFWAAFGVFRQGRTGGFRSGACGSGAGVFR